MAEISACPECQRKLQVPESFLGQTVQCPECGHLFVAKTTSMSEPPQPAAPKPTPKIEERDEGRRRYDDEDDEVDRRMPIRGNWGPHRGGLILALGLISLVGIFSLLPALLGPVAWALGTYDLREIHAGRMDPAGEGMTQAGRILGMIATGLIALFSAITCLIVAAVFAAH
jgi:hypothetical protein